MIYFSFFFWRECIFQREHHFIWDVPVSVDGINYSAALDAMVSDWAGNYECR